MPVITLDSTGRRPPETQVQQASPMLPSRVALSVGSVVALTGIMAAGLAEGLAAPFAMVIAVTAGAIGGVLVAHIRLAGKGKVAIIRDGPADNSIGITRAGGVKSVPDKEFCENDSM